MYYNYSTTSYAPASVLQKPSSNKKRHEIISDTHPPSLVLFSLLAQIKYSGVTGRRVRGDSFSLTHNPNRAPDQSAAVTQPLDSLREMRFLTVNMSMHENAENQETRGKTYIGFGDERSAGDGEAVMDGAQVLRHDGQTTALSASGACC